jgi:hypothetical protein
VIGLGGNDVRCVQLGNIIEEQLTIINYVLVLVFSSFHVYAHEKGVRVKKASA